MHGTGTCTGPGILLTNKDFSRNSSNCVQVATKTMPPLHSVPLQISGYTILPLSLPALPSFPAKAAHYIYLAPHQPRIPTATAQRSLFLVNVPFDSSELHIKHLFSLQLGLPNGRIENVQFEGGKRKMSNTEKEASAMPKLQSRSKKRKRGAERGSIEDLEDAALPCTWDRELQGNGHTTVVVFVDRASMEACLKAVKNLRKGRRELIWGDKLEGILPPLGSASANLVLKLAGGAILLI